MIATLIMVAVAISLGSFAYWYTVSYTKTSTQTVSLVIDATATNSSSGSSLQVILRNIGATPIMVEKLLVFHEHGNHIVDVNAALNAGSTLSLSFTEDDVPDMTFIAGKSYTILVKTDVGNFSSTTYCVSG